ncbi:MAG: prolipoprotein diacylglyceryl transferase family protein [Patescibacteria group bacterium]
MFPTLFKAYGLSLSSYAFFLALAAAIGIFGGYSFAVKRGFGKRSTKIALAAVSVSALVGARLLHMLINWSFYVAHPWRIWAMDTVGFSLFGGIVLATLVGIAVCRKLKLNAWKLGDTFAPFIGLGIAAMRVGCFLNGCCFGRETDLPWGAIFPVLSPAHRYQLSQSTADMFTVHPVHPTELYELAAALICSAISFAIIKRKLPDGLAILVFLILFSSFRWLNYHLRVSPATFDAPSWLYPVFYFAIIFCCSILTILRLRKKV